MSDPKPSAAEEAWLPVLGVVLIATSPAVVFPLLLHQPPAAWHVVVTTLVAVVLLLWPLLQRLSINPLVGAVADPSARDTPTADTRCHVSAVDASADGVTLGAGSASRSDR
jgi:hypothetical protein